MKATLEEKKAKAVEFLQQLDIYKPYINGFKAKSTKVCYFERFAGFWAFQNEELMKKIKEVEEKHDCLVYAVTHEYTEFGELYDMLIVTSNKDEWDSLFGECGAHQHYAFTYSWNVTDEFCSEFGDVTVRSFGGGIQRIG